MLTIITIGLPSSRCNFLLIEKIYLQLYALLWTVGFHLSLVWISSSWPPLLVDCFNLLLSDLHKNLQVHIPATDVPIWHPGEPPPKKAILEFPDLLGPAQSEKARGSRNGAQPQNCWHGIGDHAHPVHHPKVVSCSGTYSKVNPRPW